MRTPGEVVAVLMFDVDGLRDVNDSLGHAAGDRLVAEVASRLRAIAPPAALVGPGRRRRVRGDAARGRTPTSAVALAHEAAPAAAGPDDDRHADPRRRRRGRHRGAPRARHRPGDAAAAGRRGDPRGQVGRQRRAAVRPGAGVALGAPARARRRPAPGARQRRSGGLLPAQGHPARPAAGRASSAWPAGSTRRTARSRRRTSSRSPSTPASWAGSPRSCCARGCAGPGSGSTRAGRCRSRSTSRRARCSTPTSRPRWTTCCSEYGVAPDRLTLEITEDGVVGGIDRPLPTLRRLYDLGVRLSVDDFGTGYSSLSYLRRLPVHEVKIDRSFVQGMATDPGDLAIVRAVVDLSRHFGLDRGRRGRGERADARAARGDRLRHRPGLPVQPAAAVRAARGLARARRPTPSRPRLGEVRRLRAVG